MILNIALHTLDTSTINLIQQIPYHAAPATALLMEEIQEGMGKLANGKALGPASVW